MPAIAALKTPKFVPKQLEKGDFSCKKCSERPFTG